MDLLGSGGVPAVLRLVVYHMQVYEDWQGS
jgi:hypothetical protein